MQRLRTCVTGTAVLMAMLIALVAGVSAQPYGGPPMMYAPAWVTVETSGGQTWDGVWTFGGSHHSVSASWVNRQTGERVYARHMTVHQEGQQLVIARPGLGNYVGTLASDGRSISGTMSWVDGRFTARMSAGGGPPPSGYNPPGPGYGPPMMSAANWVTVETSGGQTWDGIWTFDGGHRTMSGSWVNRQTGQRVYARGMVVTQQGQQLVIARPGLGNYVGTLSSDGRSIGGTMSWVSGNFTAHM